MAGRPHARQENERYVCGTLIILTPGMTLDHSHRDKDLRVYHGTRVLHVDGRLHASLKWSQSQRD